MSKTFKQMAEDNYYGCGDSSCILQTPTGQATNGGCRCFTHPDVKELKFKVQNSMRLKNNHIAELERQLAISNKVAELAIDEITPRNVIGYKGAW